MSDPILDFAADVGRDDPVVAVGGRTQWDVGGSPAPGREVSAPAGIVELNPAEMTTRVRAGTAVSELQAALAEHGQCVALPDHDGATVGGVLAVGHSDVRRLGRGPLRDTLLEVRYVSAEGEVVKAGGPTVKNVSGFDLCRLFVGSLGTLGFAAEAVLRTRPVPEHAQWLVGTDVDPALVTAELYHPASVLWDGERTWVLLEGYGVDVESQAVVAARLGLTPTGQPPPLPRYRHSVPPSELSRLEGPFIAEVGVGIVHRPEPPAPCQLPERVARLHRAVKQQFDPTGRLNPGRAVLP